MKWGKGVPFAAWVVIDLRNPACAELFVAIGEHDPECVVDHGCERYYFMKTAFVESDAYEKLRACGYRQYPCELWEERPGADGILAFLGIDTDATLCLCYDGETVEIAALQTAELEAFGADPLELPDVLGLATGPHPRPNRDVPKVCLAHDGERGI